MSNELYHYGVLGMKWGVRKARKKAQKESVKGRSKNSTGKNYDEALSKSKSEMTALKKRTGNTANRYSKKIWDAVERGDESAVDDYEIAQRALSDLHTEYLKQRSELIRRGQRAINEASLLDAGYSKEDARRGADYLERKGINLSFYGI